MMMVNLTSNETSQHPVPLDKMHREGHAWALPPQTLTLNTVIGKYDKLKSRNNLQNNWPLLLRNACAINNKEEKLFQMNKD